MKKKGILLFLMITLSYILTACIGESKNNPNTAISTTNVDTGETKEYDASDNFEDKISELDDKIKDVRDELNEELKKEDISSDKDDDTNTKNNVYTIEEARSLKMDYGILQTDGMIRSVNSYNWIGEATEPVPSDVRLNEGEQFILIAKDKLNGLIVADLKQVFAYKLSLDTFYNSVTLQPFNYPEDKAKWGKRILSESEYPMLEEISHLAYEGELVEIDGTDISGMDKNELESYLSEIGYFYEAYTGTYHKDYCMTPEPHTFGFYKGTEYIEIALNSTMWIPWGTDSPKEFDGYKHNGLIRTKDGYFIVDLTDVPSGLYKNDSWEGNSTFYINLIQ